MLEIRDLNLETVIASFPPGMNRFVVRFLYPASAYNRQKNQSMCPSRERAAIKSALIKGKRLNAIESKVRESLCNAVDG